MPEETDDISLFGVGLPDEDQKHLADCLRSEAVRDLVRLVVAPAYHATAHLAISIRDDKTRLVEAGRYEVFQELLAVMSDLTGENFSQL